MGKSAARKALKGLLIKPQRILLVDRHRVIHQQPGLLHGIPGEQRQLSLIYPDISQALRCAAGNDKTGHFGDECRAIPLHIAAGLQPDSRRKFCIQRPRHGGIEMQNGDQHQGV